MTSSNQLKQVVSQDGKRILRCDCGFEAELPTKAEKVTCPKCFAIYTKVKKEVKPNSPQH